MKNFQRTLLLLASLFLLSACSSDKNPSVVIHTQSGSKSVRVTVELARTAGQRSMGLMYRKRLGPARGMLFLFEQEQEQRFTMRNTSIPLDMIFIDSSLTVAGILENTKPYANGPFSIDRPSRYVLEVNAGFCAQHGITPAPALFLLIFPALTAQHLRGLWTRRAPAKNNIMATTDTPSTALKKRARDIVHLLRRTYPHARTELYHRNPLELLIATILSAQCTDKKVNEVTGPLFQKYPDVTAFAQADQKTFEMEIRPTGFYRTKAAHIIATAHIILDTYGGTFPIACRT